VAMLVDTMLEVWPKGLLLNATTLPSTPLSLPKPREQCPSSVGGIINKNYFGDTM